MPFGAAVLQVAYCFRLKHIVLIDVFLALQNSGKMESTKKSVSVYLAVELTVGTGPATDCTEEVDQPRTII